MSVALGEVRKPGLTYGGGKKKEREGGGMDVSNDHSSLLSKLVRPGRMGGNTTYRDGDHGNSSRTVPGL